MKLSPHIVVADRYQLIECLGAGSMGEVWRAQDTRFESRFVAVKFLREDESLKEDRLSRDRLVVRLQQLAARGDLTPQLALETIVTALSPSDMDALRARFHARVGAEGAVPAATVIAVFDELVNDPVCNENARMRAKLRRLFRDEANSVANLRHDNIVSIFDYGDHEGNPYLVMDYIEGRTLYQVIQAREPFSRPRRLRLIEDLCAGLGYAHRKKLVHRDIKPANLIIDSSTDSLKILDFGVVRRLGSASTIGVPVGTFCYMSPEQTRGLATLDHRSDIFAVGLVFYEILSNRKAFPPGKSLSDLVSRIQRDPPAPLRELVPSIQESIDEIIRKSLEKQPENRYQDLAAMERDIARVRARLEAEEMSARTAVLPGPDDPTILKAQRAQPSVEELYVVAERAFKAGDDGATIEQCRKILALQTGYQPAIGLIAQAEARQRLARVRELLRQAEKLLSLEDLESAKATLARARDIDAQATAVGAFAQKLDAALAARAAERQRREQQMAAPPAGPPPAADTIGVTQALPREVLSRLRPPVPSSVPGSKPPSPPPRAPAPPAAAMPPPATRASDTPTQVGRPPMPVAPPASPVEKVRADPPPPASSEGATLPIRPVLPRAAPGAPSAAAAGKPAPPPPPPPAAPQRAAAAPPAADLAAARPTEPAAWTPRPLDRRALMIVVGVLAVLAIAVAAVLIMPAGGPAPAEAEPPPAVEASLPPPAADPPPEPVAIEEAPAGEPIATPNMTSVLVDVRPWARVRIVPVADGVTVPGEALFAPFTVELPPGEYTLECENGGVTRAASFKLTVGEGKPQFFSRTMPGFNATKTVDALLGQGK